MDRTYPGYFKLTSPDFSDGGEIPRECGYKNGNNRPYLKWEMPMRTWTQNPKSFALIMDDPDAMEAVGKVWVHWVVWNIPPESDRLVPSLLVEGTEGTNDFGEVGYGGPAPPDKRHTYVFKLYALEFELDLPDKSTKADVEKAMDGIIIDEATLTGTYAP